ncbi:MULTISPECIES: hypothetical protein [Bradyrhizobium]|uniref:hypothetical protein n=1 Tax=Bradyrhizobium TaxID=374 RepID=UPI001B8A5D35|nr:MULTISPECIES: hypothetical protein [Bradyrhizobium]MBR0970910.1 hypothetical protein [Bradyrhizobium japonicum]
MKIALPSMAMLGSQLVIPIGDRVPQLDVEATCKATVATGKAMGLKLSQSFDDCLRDESAAQQQLGTIWFSNSAELKNRCEGEATAGGSDGYVDLLTCIQMADWAKSSSTAPKLRGASKNRNK